MPSSDYTSAASGGLRLKGVNPSSKITKHKKKRPKPAEQSSDPTTSDPKSKSQDPNHDNLDKTPAEKLKVEEIHNQDHRDEDVLPRPAGKTEAELRHEERRRRRLEERLKREGTKTHKEKVEEFNHYLSNLSEHHDMPRIGPG
ncbi:MAG: hypothetical protein LQ337_007042 [Flavoplaca oasis]|nr:MAG: hypothetical protein LQ337_007042 [Flavoplaca oasis]